MKVTDYDIIALADHNGYPRDLARVYHGTSIVWEPKKRLVPVTGTTIPVSGVYVLYDPSHRVTVTPQFALQEVDGPQGHGIAGNTTTLDKFILWEFNSGKLKMLGSDPVNYLSAGPQTETPDQNRDALLASTGVTVSLNNASVGAGEVYPEITLPNGSFRLGITANGPDSLGKYTYYGPKWYNASLSCVPDEYLILYRVEDVQV